MNPLIAIDGPAGSGKSTIARAVATRLGLSHLDTGAMYRAVTLLVLEAALALDDGEGAARLAREMDLECNERVVVNGRDVTAEIRTPAVDGAVSRVAAHPAVRRELVARQREWGRVHGGGVVEGRDIGTVVFPGADLKVYLTADPLERARRREAQLSVGDEQLPSQAVAAELSRRDSLDSSRAASPLLVAEDAVVVDSTHLSVDDVVEEVLSHL
jgi:cytidylate kinase